MSAANLLTLTIEIIAYFAVFINISGVKFRKTGAFFAIFLTLAIHAAVLFYTARMTGSAVSVLHSVCIAVFALSAGGKGKIPPLNILCAVLSSIVYLLAGDMSSVLLAYIKTDFHYSSLAATVILALLISRVTGVFLRKRIHPLDDNTKQRLAAYTLSGAAVTLVLFLVNTFLNGLIGDTAVLGLSYAVSLIICFVFLVFVIFVFTDSLRKEMEITNRDELLQNLQIYTESVEAMSAEVRKFRHDHINLMMGFGEYIENNDIIHIREYFGKYIALFKESSAADTRLDILMRIKIPEVKSILSFKFLYAQQLGIDTHIEIPEIIGGDINLNLIDLCRIIGILLDNAIEACKGAAPPVLRFLALKKDGIMIFVFSNTCESLPPLSKINEKGYTTKENGRGLGLYTVSALIERDENLSLDTRINEEEMVFIQELSVVTPQGRPSASKTQNRDFEAPGVAAI